MVDMYKTRCILVFWVTGLLFLTWLWCAPAIGATALPPEDVSSLEWVRISGAPVQVRLSSIAVVSSTSGWAVGGEGIILHHDGHDWAMTSSPTIERLNSIAMVSTDEGWIAGEYGTLLYLQEGVWTIWPQQLPDINFHAIAAADAYHIWAVGRAGTIVAYDGIRWTTQESGVPFALNGVAAFSPTLAFAVGSGGTILSYRGDRWRAEASPTTVALSAVTLLAADDGWAVGSDGVILHYDGYTWTLVPSPVRDPLFAVTAVAKDSVWAAGRTGLLLHYDGYAWNQVDGPEAYSLYGMTTAYNGDVWAVGFGSALLHYDGVAWSHASRITSSTFYAVTEAQDARWAVGEAGALWVDRGSGWLAEQSPVTLSLHAAAGDTAGILWLAGAEGVLLKRTPDAHWDVLTSPTTLTLRGLTFPAPGVGWAVGGDVVRRLSWAQGTLLYYDGLSWTEVMTFPEESLYAISFYTPDIGWAVGDAGSIWRYDGAIWQREVTPVHTTLQSVAALGAEEAWAVGEAGVILHRQGDHWVQVPSPTSHRLYDVLMRDTTEGWAFGDTGVLLHYDGLSWHILPSPTQYRLFDGMFDTHGTLWSVGNTGTLLRRVTPVAGSFRLMADQTEYFAQPGATIVMTAEITALDGYTRPLDIQIAGLNQDLIVDWVTSTVSPPSLLEVQLTLPITYPTGVSSLTVVAGDGLVTRTLDFHFTILPGIWEKGLHTSLGRVLRDVDIAVNTAWAVGDGGVIVRYDHRGLYEYAPCTHFDLYAVDVISSTLGWAVGDGGTLLHFDGSSWIGVTSPTTMPLHSIASRRTDDVWVVGGGGTLLHYDGEQWQQTAAPSTDWLYAVALADDGSGWAVGWGGAIWRYANDVWQVFPSPTHQWLRAVTVLSPDEAWAVGSQGTLLHYISGNWHLIPGPTASRLFDVWFTAHDDGWAVGGDGDLLHYDGQTWKLLPNVAPTSFRALALADLYGLAVGDMGQISCYLPVGQDMTQTLLLPGCGATPGSVTQALPHLTYLPVVGRHSLFEAPLEVFGVQTVGGAFSRDPAIVFHMHAAGIRWARLSLYWNQIEPFNTEPDEFRWSMYDDWLELLSQAEIQPLLFLNRQPAWASTFVAGALDESDSLEFGEFVRAAVARYSAPPYGVTHWEVYNEPDNSDISLAERGWGFWGNDGAGYAEQLALVYPAMKSANLAAQLVFGGVAHEYFVENGGPFVRSFITDVLKAGGGAYFDVFNFHYYGTDLPGQIRYFRQMLAGYELNKPLICTEAGTHSGIPAVEDAGDIYAEYLPKVMVQGIAGGLRIVDWFALADMESTWRPGLFSLKRTFRPTYRVYQVLTGVLRSARYQRPLSIPENPHASLAGYVFSVPQANGRLDVVWDVSGQGVVWQVSAPWVYITDREGNTWYKYDGQDGVFDGRTTLFVDANPLYVLYGR